MSSLKHIRQLLQSPTARAGVADLKQRVLGQAPQLHLRRTGRSLARTQLKGTYDAQYYVDPIERSARQVIPGFQTDLEERQHNKLMLYKRRGKGPPKKGSGSRASKKKK